LEGQANRLAFFRDRASAASSGEKRRRIFKVTENSTKTRDQAETAFSRTQTQFMARNRTISEIDDVAAEREAKTLRLRQLRLEREASAPVKLPASRKSAKR
jgi:hypothetical protein